MGILRRTGLSEEAAQSTYGALRTYTIGFAALKASRANEAPEGNDINGLAIHREFGPPRDDPGVVFFLRPRTAGGLRDSLTFAYGGRQGYVVVDEADGG